MSRQRDSTYSSTSFIYIYVQFSTAFPFVSLLFFFAQSLLFSVFSGGLELLDLAGYAYDDVFYKVL